MVRATECLHTVELGTRIILRSAELEHEHYFLFDWLVECPIAGADRCTHSRPACDRSDFIINCIFCLHSSLAQMYLASPLCKQRIQLLERAVTSPWWTGENSEFILKWNAEIYLRYRIMIDHLGNAQSAAPKATWTTCRTYSSACIDKQSRCPPARLFPCNCIFRAIWIWTHCLDILPFSLLISHKVIDTISAWIWYSHEILKLCAFLSRSKKYCCDIRPCLSFTCKIWLLMLNSLRLAGMESHPHEKEG